MQLTKALTFAWDPSIRSESCFQFAEMHSRCHVEGKVTSSRFAQIGKLQVRILPWPLKIQSSGPLSQINAALSYFEEACSYKRAAHALRLRAEAHSNLPADQVQQRRVILLLAAKILEDEIQQLIPLGISTWQAATRPDAPPDLIQP